MEGRIEGLSSFTDYLTRALITPGSDNIAFSPVNFFILYVLVKLRSNEENFDHLFPNDNTTQSTYESIILLRKDWINHTMYNHWRQFDFQEDNLAWVSSLLDDDVREQLTSTDWNFTLIKSQFVDEKWAVQRGAMNFLKSVDQRKEGIHVDVNGHTLFVLALGLSYRVIWGKSVVDTFKINLEEPRIEIASVTRTYKYKELAHFVEFRIRAMPIRLIVGIKKKEIDFASILQEISLTQIINKFDTSPRHFRKHKIAIPPFSFSSTVSLSYVMKKMKEFQTNVDESVTFGKTKMFSRDGNFGARLREMYHSASFLFNGTDIIASAVTCAVLDDNQNSTRGYDGPKGGSKVDQVILIMYDRYWNIVYHVGVANAPGVCLDLECKFRPDVR